MQYFNKTQLVEGEIYVSCKSLPRILIFKLGERGNGYGCLNSHFLNLSGAYKKGTHTACSPDEAIFRHPSIEEAQWMETCIRENRTLTLEESMLINKTLYEIF